MKQLSDATRKVGECHQALVAHAHAQGLAQHPAAGQPAMPTGLVTAPLGRPA